MRCLIGIVWILGMMVYGCSPEPQSGTSSQKSTESPVAEQPNVKDMPKEGAQKTIVFFGNSLTAGYQLDISEAFPALIQEKIDSLGLNYTVVNSGVSGETTAGGKTRVNWVLKQKVDVFVLELGANDGMRGTPTSTTKQNLQSIIDQVRTKYPDVKIVLTGMEVPPNMGGDYAAEFRKIFKELVAENKTAFIPFLLEGVAGEPELNLSDGIHPTSEGHKILANTVWKVLKDLL